MPPSLHLALALIRIPHLAFSLFVVPLFIGLLLVTAQLLVTGTLLLMSNPRLGDGPKEAPQTNSDGNLVRLILYGDNAIRPPLTVCRWKMKETGEEVPPSNAANCIPDRLDVAIRSNSPEVEDTSEYQALFSGQIDRLHVCATCTPDVVLTPGTDDKDALAKVHSVFGLALLSLPLSNSQLLAQQFELRQEFKRVTTLLGTVYFDLPEIPGGINATALRHTLPITLNIAALIITTLWLGLRAHRKVLDYFSHNDVLLPLVAACGKNKFYSALWILTLIRVGCFLIASVPILIFGIHGFLGKNSSLGIGTSKVQFFVWLVTISSSLALTTVLASLAELRHRQSCMSLLYRYLPLLCAGIGAVLWIATLLSQTTTMAILRATITAIPILGSAPLLVAPILNLPSLVMVPHAILSIAIFVTLLRKNARWFAAHLDEV